MPRSKLKTISAMPMGFIKLGTDTWFPIDDIHMILTPKGLSMERMREAYKKRGTMVNLTGTNRMRSMILVLPSNHLLISHHTTTHIVNEMQKWYVAMGR